MGRSMRIRSFLWRHGLKPRDIGYSVVALSLTLIVTGCSADVSRFDFPSFSLNGEPGSTGALGNDAMRSANLSDQQPGDGSIADYQPPSQSRSGDDVRVAALPEASQTPSYETPPSTGRYQPSAAAADNFDRPPVGRTIENSNRPNYESQRAARSVEPSASQITVERGDTLYGLSRRHGVTVTALMDANNLETSVLRPGQVLDLPNGASAPSRRAPAKKARVATRTPSTSSDWSGRYTVESGDSLYRIARRFGVNSRDLQSYNDISDPRRLRPGMVLRVPGNGAASQGGQSYAGRVEPVAPKAPRVVQSRNTPKVINGKRRVAALTDKTSKSRSSVTDARRATIAPPQGTTAKLNWPVKGKVIDGFGRRSDGTHNDGVNLAVPAGTPVYAAESGVVAYAGSELKGYGNLILVRHDNGWVTAYAHNQSILVKRGDKVKRGQPIAKAGQSGQVDRPQVHFELRKGSKPVDPVPYLTRG